MTILSCLTVILLQLLHCRDWELRSRVCFLESMSFFESFAILEAVTVLRALKATAVSKTQPRENWHSACVEDAILPRN